MDLVNRPRTFVRQTLRPLPPKPSAAASFANTPIQSAIDTSYASAAPQADFQARAAAPPTPPAPPPPPQNVASAAASFTCLDGSLDCRAKDPELRVSKKLMR